MVRSPLTERAAAPRQPSVAAARDVAGRIELEAGRGFEDALDGLVQWDYVWVIFVFHKNVEEGRGFRPKVRPPRAPAKMGVFATRSPHRPNPIGLSAVRIAGVSGLVVHVRELDLLDGTPVLDIKPYVPYADAHPAASHGWLATPDPASVWRVAFEAAALEQLAWLRDSGVDLRAAIERALSLGPAPHAYRRIRPHGAGMRLSIKDWRVDFVQDGVTLTVGRIASGYRPEQLARDASLGVHRRFVAAFGA